MKYISDSDPPFEIRFLKFSFYLVLKIRLHQMETLRIGNIGLFCGMTSREGKKI
jgi:hypothetical protein